MQKSLDTAIKKNTEKQIPLAVVSLYGKGENIVNPFMGTNITAKTISYQTKYCTLVTILLHLAVI